MNNKCPYLEMQCANLKCDCAKYKAYVDAKNPEIFQQVMLNNNFDVNLPDFELIYSMQKSFASRMRKMEGLTKQEIDKWIDQYLVCIEDEIREVREHLDLYGETPKYDSEVDKNLELKKEVIDILHFMMELFIVGNADKNIIKKHYNDMYNVGWTYSNVDLFEEAYDRQSITLPKYLNSFVDRTHDITVLKASCRLSDACALVRQQISWKHWKKPSDTINYEKLYDAYAVVFHEFINLCVLTMDEKEIRTIYVNKNVENILRQKYGY